MLLVLGDDTKLCDRVVDALGRRGLVYRRGDVAHAVAERGNLFQAAFAARATGLVVVEPMARGLSAAPAPSATDALLDAALAAASAPGLTRLVLVTSRPDDDDGLRKLRRNGVPYVVLRSAPLVELLPEGVEGGLRERSVLIPAEVAAALSSTVPAVALAEAVVEAVTDAPPGRVVDLAPSAETSLEQVLARAGAKPRVVASWRSRVGRWFGQAIARVEGDHVIIDGAAPFVAEAAPAAA